MRRSPIWAMSSLRCVLGLLLPCHRVQNHPCCADCWVPEHCSSAFHPAISSEEACLPDSWPSPAQLRRHRPSFQPLQGDPRWAPLQTALSLVRDDKIHAKQGGKPASINKLLEELDGVRSGPQLIVSLVTWGPKCS